MAVVMLWWKQQVNTGYWRKNIYCKWNTAMRAFVLVFVHNQTSQLLFVTVRWKQITATLARFARDEIINSLLSRPYGRSLRENYYFHRKSTTFQSFRHDSVDIRHHYSVEICWNRRGIGGVTPGNSWCRGAARLSKSSPFFRPKLPATSKELNYFKFSLNLFL